MAATTRQKSGWITANVVVILLVLIPVVWIASLSFKDPSTITNPTYFPTKWTWSNYKGIFTSSEFTRPLLNSIGIGLPLGIYTLSAFFREIPWELEKAAKMDGATPFQAFVRVIAPLAAPGMVTTAILVFLFCWNEFLLAITLTSTIAARTAPAALAFFTGSSQFAVPTGSISAAAVVITIPIIIFVLFFQRRIVAGLTSGAVKG